MLSALDGLAIMLRGSQRGFQSFRGCEDTALLVYNPLLMLQISLFLQATLFVVHITISGQSIEAVHRGA